MKLNSKFLFYQPSFEESSINTIFLHGAQAAGGDFYLNGFVEFRHKNALFLKIRIFSDFAGRVEFGGAGAIAVSSADN